MTSSLPSSLENLVLEYKDENTYKQNLNNSNPVIRDQTILDELANIGINEIINFKLARQLAINYLEIADYDINIDLSCLAGIFLSLLGTFSYEELLNPKEQGFQIENLTISVDDYIFLLLNSIQNKVTDYLSVTNISPKLTPDLRKRILDIYPSQRDEEQLYLEAYKLMIKEEPEVYSNVAVNNYMPELIKWINYILTKEG